MRDSKKTNILLAMVGAAVLMASSPVLAQDTTAPDPAAAEATTPAPWPRPVGQLPGLTSLQALSP